MAFHLSLNFEQTEESCIMKNVTSRVVNLTPLLILFLCSLALTKASSAASYVNVFVNLPAYSAQDTSSPAMDNTPTTLDSLTNFQTNSNTMLSSGLPSPAHLLLLKQEGVVRVIDLIPGNRSEEISIVLVSANEGNTELMILNALSDEEMTAMAKCLPEELGNMSALQKLGIGLRILVKRPSLIRKGVISTLKSFGYSRAKYFGW